MNQAERVEKPVKGLPEKRDWTFLMQTAKTVSLEKDEVVIREQHRVQKIFQLVSGKLRVEKQVPSNAPGEQYKDLLLGTIEPGDSFGEISFLDQGLASASVIVQSSQCQLFVLEKHVLDLICFLDITFALKFYKYLAVELSKRLRQREKSILGLSSPRKPQPNESSIGKSTKGGSTPPQSLSTPLVRPCLAGRLQMGVTSSHNKVI